MTSPTARRAPTDARVAFVLGGLVGAIAFGVGTTWSASAPRPSAGDEVRGTDLDGIRELLGELQRTIEQQSDADELAPVRVAAGREGPSGRDDGLTSRLDALLDRLDALEANAGVATQRDWRQVEREIESLRRPADLPELQRFVERYRKAIDTGRLPLEVTLLGVREVIDRFGWPDSLDVSSDANGPFILTYLFGVGPDGSSTRVVLYCTQFRTSYVGVED